MLAWLLGVAIGPAAVGFPVSWTAESLAGAARRWFRRLHRTDDLSRLVRAAVGTSIDLTGGEFRAVRRLLEDQQTWRVLAQGTLEGLVRLIADCLPSRDSRSPEDSQAAALAIAHGLLKFAIFDLEPDIFQKVVLARLQRITDQACEVDKALLYLHSDLYARLEGVVDPLKRALEMQAGPAGRGELTIYLQTLIAWLNTDPWPRQQRLGGPVLTLAEIERKLSITSAGQARGKGLDADDQAKRCQRLVILGGPGSGKTWLAMRTARVCAEEALQALAADENLDEMDLPLYTTCSHLVSTRGDIREAAASSALELIGDLGGSRIVRALREFFTERRAPTLLVIDSLDEASDASIARERLRQADSLQPPWRVILTSRLSAWDHQLSIEAGNETHLVGELQPLRYPNDVELAIRRWFADNQEHGAALAAQIAGRPSLQRAATVPLILAFYCILGANQPLPEFRYELYKQVINRMLRSPWRSSSGPPPDVDACRTALRSWAWRGAKDNPVSGVGQWADEIPTKRALLSPAGQHAVDHVAAPSCPPDYDTNETSRRFVHRSIQEHLVAEHVASLPMDKAAQVLLPHLWYDSDWEDAAPAALVMHPERDQLLHGLMCLAARSNQVPEDLSVIDAGRELRRFLARVAAESNEDEWSPEATQLIGTARADLLRSEPAGNFDGLTSWGMSNRQIRDNLFGVLTSKPHNLLARGLVNTFIDAALTIETKEWTRQVLLGLLARQPESWLAANLVCGLARLDPTIHERTQARETLLRDLGTIGTDLLDEERLRVLATLAPTAGEKAQARAALLQLLDDRSKPWMALDLVGGLIRLDPTTGERARARAALLERLAGESSGFVAAKLASRLVELDPAARERAQARAELFKPLVSQTEGMWVEQLLDAIVQLSVTPKEIAQARDTLLRLLPDQADGLVAADFVYGLIRLNLRSEGKVQTRETLLALLTWHLGADPRSVPTPSPHIIGGSSVVGLVWALDELNPTADDKIRARAALLVLIAHTNDGELAQRAVRQLVQIGATPEDKSQARESLFRLLASEPKGVLDDYPVDGLVLLGPTAEDKVRAREALLGVMADQPEGLVAVELTRGLIKLDPTDEDKALARAILLSLLASPRESRMANRLADSLIQVDPTSQDKAQAREALLTLLVNQSTDFAAADRIRAQGLPERERRLTLKFLGDRSGSDNSPGLVEALVKLDPTAEEKCRAREAVLKILERPTLMNLQYVAAPWVGGLIQLAPTVQDLDTLRALAIPPSRELLTALRENCTTAAWLECLPLLT